MQQPPYPPGFGSSPPGPGPYPSAPPAWAPPPAAPKRSGPSVGVWIGLGCGALLLIGLLVGGAILAVMSMNGKGPLATKSRPTATASGPPPQAELRDMRTWRGETGLRHVVGEIVNTGATPVVRPVAKVTFYDANNVEIDSGTCAAHLETLAPNEKTPCSLVVKKTETYASYKAEISSLANATPRRQAELRVTEVKYTSKKGGSPASLDGKITNASPFRAHGVIAVASFYGADGKIVASAVAVVPEKNLESGASGLFSAKVLDFAAPAENYRVKAVGYERE